MSRMMHMFRKYQYMLLIVFGVLLMFVFVIGDALTGLMSGPGGGGGQSDEVVLTWKHGSVSGNDLYSQRVRHNMAVDFLSEVVQETVRREGTPKGPGVYRDQFGRYNPGITVAENDETIVQKMLLAAKAESLGVKVDNDTVKAFLNQLSDGELTENDLGVVYNKTIAGRITQQQLMDQLQHELLAQQMLMMTRAGLFVVPPHEAWDFHNRMQRRVQTELVALSVDSFKDKVTKTPSDAEIQTLYDEGKNRFPNPYSPEPGFKRRHKIAFEYVRADSGKLQDEEAAKIKDTITDEDIEKYYEENKERYRVIELPGDEAEAAPAESTPEASSESNDTPAAEDAPKEDAAKEDAAKEDAAKEDAAKEEAAPAPPAADAPAEPAAAETEPAPATEAPAEPKEETNCAPQEETPTETTEPATTPEPAAPAEPTPPAAETPAPAAETPPVTETPAAEAPATTPETEPAADPPASESPEATPPAPATETSETAPATEEPETPRYKPLDDKLRGEIRDEIATDRSRQPAQERLDKAFDEIKAEIDSYGRQIRRSDVSKSGTKPTAVDYEALALERGMTAGKIDPTDALGIEEYEIGKAYEMDFRNFTSWPPPRITFAQMAYAESVQLYRTQRIKSAELDVEFLFWKVAEEEAYVPELKDIRDEVIETWKRQEAFVIAKAEAERLAKEAASDKPLGEALSAHDGLEIIQPAPFSWMSTGTTPFGGAGSPTLGQVEGVEAAGNDFMKSVFSLKQGEVGVAVDQPQTHVYVVRIAAETPSEDMLKEQFLSSGVTPEMSQIAFVEIEDVWQDWYKDLEKEMRVEWKE